MKTYVLVKLFALLEKRSPASCSPSGLQSSARTWRFAVIRFLLFCLLQVLNCNSFASALSISLQSLPAITFFCYCFVPLLLSQKIHLSAEGMAELNQCLQSGHNCWKCHCSWVWLKDSWGICNWNLQMQPPADKDEGISMPWGYTASCTSILPPS